MQKRLFHLSFCIVLLLSLDCFAGGTYQVGQDQGGIYFQTDNNGGWYIGKSDLKDFKIGQTGAYSIGKDRNGTFLITDTNRKFYLDMKALEKQVFENERTNQEYDRKMEIMQQKEARKNAEQARLKAQEREARAERELYLKIEEQKLDELVKSHRAPFAIIPAKAGIQYLRTVANHLDSGFRRSDDFLRTCQT